MEIPFEELVSVLTRVVDQLEIVNANLEALLNAAEADNGAAGEVAPPVASPAARPAPAAPARTAAAPAARRPAVAPVAKDGTKLPTGITPERKQLNDLVVKLAQAGGTYKSGIVEVLAGYNCKSTSGLNDEQVLEVLPQAQELAAGLQ